MMEMTDREILRKYENASTPHGKRQMMKILAELNGVSVPVMTAHIAAIRLEADQKAEAPKAKIRDRTKEIENVHEYVEPEKKNNKAAGVVVDAVKLRLEEVGSMTARLRRL